MSHVCHINLARGFRGGERQTELLIRGLAGHGLEQTLVARRGQPLADCLRSVRGLQTIEIGKPFIRHLRALPGNLLHAHDNKGAHLAYWAQRLRGQAYVVTRRVDNRPGANWHSRAVYRRAQGVAAVSRAVARVLHDYAPGLPVTHIPDAHAGLPVDHDAAAALRRAWGGEFVVGQVAALDDRHKGQRHLIAAARELLAQHPGWRFVLVGGGPDEARLRAQAADLAGVIFTGHVANVGDYLSALDVLVAPSLYEALGSSLLDAMHFGLPVVATRVGGIPEIITHGAQGLLVPPADPRALAHALAQLHDVSGLRQKMAEAGRTRAADFSPQTMCERYLAWYSQLGFRIGA